MIGFCEFLCLLSFLFWGVLYFYQLLLLCWLICFMSAEWEVTKEWKVCLSVTVSPLLDNVAMRGGQIPWEAIGARDYDNYGDLGRFHFMLSAHNLSEIKRWTLSLLDFKTRCCQKRWQGSALFCIFPLSYKMPPWSNNDGRQFCETWLEYMIVTAPACACTAAYFIKVNNV